MNWVILPGMDGTGDLLARFVAQVPAGDVCVVVRYPNRVLSRDELVSIVREALPVFEDYILVAESFSGQFAIEVAARKPPGLKGLVLVNTFAKLSGRWTFVLRVVGGLLMRTNPPRWVIRNFLTDGDASSGDVGLVKAAIARVSGNVLASRLRFALQCDVKVLLPQIRAPTLVIASTRDRLLSRETTLELAQGISGAKVAWLDGPHLALFARSARAFAEIQDFI